MNNLIKWELSKFVVVISCLVGKINWRLAVTAWNNWMSDTNTLPLRPIWCLEARLVFCSTTSLLARLICDVATSMKPFNRWNVGPHGCQVTAAWLVCFPINNPDFAHLTAYCTPKSKCLDLKVRHDVFCFLIANLTNCFDVSDRLGVG